MTRCDAAVLGTGVVTWWMWGMAWSWGGVSGVVGAAVGVVLTGGRVLATVGWGVACFDMAVVGTGVVTWRGGGMLGRC
jgi:hypothetical protein